jgi:hypothetical protein
MLIWNRKLRKKNNKYKEIERYYIENKDKLASDNT